MGTSVLSIFLLLAFVIHYASAGDGHVEQPPSQPVKPKSEMQSQQPAVSKSYTKPPSTIIDTSKSYQAVVNTNKGSFTIELFAYTAPKTVNNFVFLAKDNYYNDIVFHRIIKSFVIQTGDPTGTGRGGPGYKFEDELNPVYKYEPGIVAMANAGPNTNGSQFFICTGEDSRNLDTFPNYTIFGKVIDGMDVVQAIADTPVDTNLNGERSHPVENVVMQSIEIIESAK